MSDNDTDAVRDVDALIHYELADGIARITINAPNRGNALGSPNGSTRPLRTSRSERWFFEEQANVISAPGQISAGHKGPGPNAPKTLQTGPLAMPLASSGADGSALWRRYSTAKSQSSLRSTGPPPAAGLSWHWRAISS